MPVDTQSPRAKSWDTEKTSVFDKRRLRPATPGEVATTLRDLRADRDLGVREVTEQAKLPVGTTWLYALERGQVKPPWKPRNKMLLARTIAALAVFYDVSVETIMQREVGVPSD